MTTEKQPYEVPELTRFGSVAILTKQSNLENADVPQGSPGTGFPTQTPGS